MGKKMATTAFAKSGFKQSFVSSFYSALQRVTNRKARLEEYLEKVEDGNLDGLLDIDYKEEMSDEEIEDDSFEEDSLSKVSKEELKSVSRENFINACTTELTSIEGIIDLGNKIIEDKRKEKKEADPKIVKMIEIVEETINSSKKPILIFAHYLATLDQSFLSLKEALNRPEVGVGMFKGTEIWYEIEGNRYPADRNQIKNLLFNGDIQVLFCSEAASEGINLQAADMMINMDVPWVPSVLEQRIGRIARLGQKSKKVTIHNLWYPDSYEAQMYTALLERQDLMELAMGHFPNIVSDAIKNKIGKDDSGIKKALDELDRLKSDTSFTGLSRLWGFDKEIHEPYGDLFRKNLIKVLDELGYETSSYTFSAGSDNVINLRSNIIKEFILNNEVSQTGKSSIHTIMNANEKLVGFAYEEAGLPKKIINPRYFPEIFFGIYKGYINDIKNMLIETDIALIKTEDDYFDLLSREVTEWIVPQHRKIVKAELSHVKESGALTYIHFAKVD
tara:strand:- start:196 stop:1707 length:1512 start_codon:yes stop_codon:yes gene_type:complete